MRPGVPQAVEGPGEPSELDGDPEVKALICVWERAIQTQMHFAELSIKTRQIGLTIVGATLGLAGLLHKTNSSFDIKFLSLDVSSTTILCLAAALTLYSIKILDVNVYHNMLRGAVAFNIAIEPDLIKRLQLPVGLTESITIQSRNPKARWNKFSRTWNVSGPKEDAAERIAKFYRIMIIALVLSAIFFFADANL